MTSDVLVLQGVLRRYAWGSPTAIPAMLGEAADGRPAAELWFGAHPDDPSVIAGRDRTLELEIDEQPSAVLGDVVVERFGPRLPFLLKVLAAAQALSMQVHPTRAQAEAGFAAEDAAGIARDAPNRSYRDRNHKPELLCALEPFVALCGFRPPADTIAIIDALPADAQDALADVRVDLSAAAFDAPAAIEAAFTRLLMLSDEARSSLVERVVTACRSVVGDGADVARALLSMSDEQPVAAAARAVVLCADDFPGDVGAVLSLLLNVVRLGAGEAIYLGAGNVHAYLRGTGVEILANSDNVLRCALTPKHVDVGELLRIVDFAPLAEPRWPRDGDAFDVPVPDFRLREITGEVSVDGPAIVLSTGDAVEVGGVTLTGGHAAFVPAAAGPVTASVANGGRSYVAGVGVTTTGR